MFPSQSTAEGVPCVVVADFCCHAATTVIDVLRPSAAALGGNALQAVGIVGGGLSGRLGDHHTVPVQKIPSQGRSRIWGGNAAQQAVGVVGIALGIPVLARIALQQVQGVIGVTGRPGSGLLFRQVAVVVVGVGGDIAACDTLCQLVGGVVGHGGGDAALYLLGHVPHCVIGILFADSIAAGKPGKLSQRVIGKCAVKGRTVLGAAFADHPTRAIIGIFQ